MAKLIHISILLLIVTEANAQFRYSLDQQIPVQDANGNNLALPWAGGLNATQYNTMDLDNDGDEDLVLFDRMANKVITLLNVDGAYTYHPEYESLFPEELTNWLLLRDYNCDGLKDVFTGDPLGIRVFKNTTAPGEQLSWEHYRFSASSAGAKSDVLLTQGIEFKVNLQLQFDDLPAIVDADGDGDLDIFNVRYAGHGVEFHRNLSIENSWNCDSLEFTRVTTKWGDFSECHCEHIALNGDDCSAGGKTKHAGGKALLALDANGDQNLDIIFSEAECPQLFQMTNTGTVSAPVVNSYHAFPQSTPVNLTIFPAAFYEDVDFDGVKDLLSSPNIFSKEFITTNLSESNWFYKNTGTNENPSFSFVQRNFLQDQMIDVGDNSVPAFHDYDADGDQDMMISQHAGPSLLSTISLYENIGSPSEPAFRLRENDFLSFSNLQVYNAKIQFIDVDGNKTIDLAWTGTEYNNSVTSLFFIRNTSQSGFSIEGGQAIETVDFDLTSGENIRFADVDGDGLADILAGRSNGAVEYWRNTGNADEFTFTLEDETFLGLGTGVQRQNLSCFIADLDGDGRQDFCYGDQSGKLYIISDFNNASEDQTPMTDLIYNPFKDEYRSPNLGGRAFPVAVDLYKSSKPAIVSGNFLGGIHILRNENQSSLFPNPVVKNDHLNIEVDELTTLYIYSSTGRLVNEPLNIAADDVHLDDVHLYDVSDLAAGFYIFKFISRSKTITRKVVIR